MARGDRRLPRICETGERPGHKPQAGFIASARLGLSACSTSAWAGLGGAEPSDPADQRTWPDSSSGAAAGQSRTGLRQLPEPVKPNWPSGYATVRDLG